MSLVPLLASPEVCPPPDGRRATDLDLTAFRVAAEDLVARLDIAQLDANAATHVVRDVTAICNMMATVKAIAAAVVAASTVWKKEGAVSAEAWLAAASGASAGQAREVLATAARLRTLPRTAAVARRGGLSPQQVAAITDAAVVAPAREAELLELADREGLGRLRESCLRVKSAADPSPEATYLRQRAARSLIRRTDGEGMWTLWARSTADDGARFNAALDPIIDEKFRAAHRAGVRESREALALDALIELAARAVGATPIASPSSRPVGDDGPPEAGRGPARGAVRTPEPFQAILRVDLEALTRGQVRTDEVCEIDGVGPVPVCRARELLGEAVLKVVITKGVAVRTVTHLGRGPMAAQKIALLWEQPVCQVSGCGRRSRLEFDHNVPWAEDHVTEVGNLDRLCGQHHELKSVHNWALVRGFGVRRMVPPNHPEHPG